MGIYRAMLKQQPNIGEVWNNLGVATRETGDPDEAISCFRKAVAFAPNMAEAWNNLGVAQDEFNMAENAANSYGKAIELRPDYASAHVNLGISLQKLGQYAEAEDHYRIALKSKPDDEVAGFMLQSLGKSDAPDAALRGMCEGFSTGAPGRSNGFSSRIWNTKPLNCCLNWFVPA